MQPRLPDRAQVRADLCACRIALRNGSKSFAAASRLLPVAIRDSATILYAFCREADDAVDLEGDGAAAVPLLRERLDAIYSGAPQARASDRALARVVLHHRLPRTLLDALLEGFEWDAIGRRYESWADLEAYAARVAGTIGAMMAVLMDARDEATLARACELGVAMQLTNIARDVGEDARAGRLYLPRQVLREVGIDADEWLQRPVASEALRSVVRQLLRRADDLYDGVASGVAALPFGCRPGINAARLIYAHIGRSVERAGHDSVTTRAVVGGRRKLWLVMQAYALVAKRARPTLLVPLACTRFLIDAAFVPVSAGHVLPSSIPWWRVRSRAIWLIDLFEQMERRERLVASPGHAQSMSRG